MLPRQINESVVVISTLFKFWLVGFHQPAQEQNGGFSFTGYQNGHLRRTPEIQNKSLQSESRS